MLDSVASAKEIRDRLRNPKNARVSEETDVLSAPELRRRRIEVMLAADEAEREKGTQERWDAIIQRLKQQADNAAADIALQENQERDRGSLTMEMIVRVTCGFFHIKRIDLVSARRTASVVYPRQIGMYLCREHTTFSLPQIGAKFGGKDHTTVLHSFHKISTLITIGDTKVITDIRRLRTVLGVE